MNTHTPALYALLPKLRTLTKSGTVLSEVHDILWPDQNDAAFRALWTGFIWEPYPQKVNHAGLEALLLLVAALPQDDLDDFILAWASEPCVKVRSPRALDASPAAPTVQPLPRAVLPYNPLARAPAIPRMESFHGIRSL